MAGLAATVAEALPSAVMGAAGAIAPMLQAQKHHGKEIEVTHELHRTAISQAERLHEEEVEVSKGLHLEAIQHESDLHLQAIGHAERLHEIAIEKEQKLHRQAQGLSARLHLEALKQELQHHTQQMAHDTETARRENLRDVWSQRNRKAETLMITNTLMFGCFFAMIVEGMPEENSSTALLTIYAIAVSLSFCFLFICMWFTMKTQARMTKFNMYNPKQLYTCGDVHSNFEDYYKCHAEKPAKIAQHCFYYGTMSLVVAAAALVYSRMKQRFDLEWAGLIFVIIAGFTAVSLLVFRAFFPTQTREIRPEDDIAAAQLYAGQSPYSQDASDNDVAKVMKTPGAGPPPLSRKMTFNGSMMAAIRKAEREAETIDASLSPAATHELSRSAIDVDIDGFDVE